MDGKFRKSATDTYILDEDEVDQLDELSLTSVIGDVTDSLDQAGREADASQPEPEEAPPPSIEGDPTINELLDDSSVSAPPPLHEPHDFDRVHSEPGGTEGDLLAPELLFSAESDETDDDAS